MKRFQGVAEEHIFTLHSLLQHLHNGATRKVYKLFSVEALTANNSCWGGCGVVSLESLRCRY